MRHACDVRMVSGVMATWGNETSSAQARAPSSSMGASRSHGDSEIPLGVPVMPAWLRVALVARCITESAYPLRQSWPARIPERALLYRCIGVVRAREHADRASIGWRQECQWGSAARRLFRKFKRPKDGAQKGSEKKDHDDTDDKAEKKEGKGAPKLIFSRADALKYSRANRTNVPK
jgi:hypothetical protein